jgi:hypothetical protein
VIPYLGSLTESVLAAGQSFTISTPRAEYIKSPILGTRNHYQDESFNNFATGQTQSEEAVSSLGPCCKF